MGGFFNENSMGVKSALYMFEIGEYKSIEEVPDLFNLREVVLYELEKLK